MFMFERIKKMQEQGIFKFPYAPSKLDNEIKNITTEEEIQNQLDQIQNYIKILDMELINNSTVKLYKTLYDFYDKIEYELPKIFASKTIEKDGNYTIYTKKISFGGKEKGLLGLTVSNQENTVMFSLEEQKLLKLINHYYISLKSNDDYEDELFYIPMNSLKIMFKEDSNLTLNKEKIIKTCELLNDKKITWDFEGTIYDKKLSKSKLTIGKIQKLVNIKILFYPRIQKLTKDGNTKTISTTLIKGIICEPTDIMKLRYQLAQISNRFPKEIMSEPYLEYTITDNLVYFMNLLDANNSKYLKRANSKYLDASQKNNYRKKIKNEFTKNLHDFIKGMDLVVQNRNDDNCSTENSEQKILSPGLSSYMSIIIRDPNQKRRIGLFYEALTVCIEKMIKSNTVKSVSFVVNNNSIPLMKPYAPTLESREWKNVANEIIIAFHNKLNTNNLIDKIYNIINSRNGITIKNSDDIRHEITKTLNYFQYNNNEQKIVNLIMRDPSNWTKQLEQIRNMIIKKSGQNFRKKMTVFKLICDGEIQLKIEI